MRTIDADALEVVTAKVPKGMDAKSYMAGMEYILSQIDALPTIEERKTGKWIRTRTMKHDGELYCDQCEQEHPEQMKIWNFCPNCGAKMEGGTSMTATERSEKLPIGYEVRLMKICERCTYPKLQIEVGRTFSEKLLNIKGRKGIIRCENEIKCRAVIEMYEGAKYDGEGIPEQDTSI